MSGETMDIMKKAEKIAAAAKASCSELSQASSGMKQMQKILKTERKTGSPPQCSTALK
jgi:hypothetical protein